MFQDKPILKKWIAVVILVFIAVLSATVVTEHMTSAENHAASIRSLEDKKMKAMELTATVALTSTAISAIPGDAATPIATQISQLTTPLLIVVSALYLEKFLLTTIGYISFRFLIPSACLLCGIYLFWSKEAFKILAAKLAIFAIVISSIIPMSVKLTTLIEETFQESIEQTYETVDEIAGEAEKAEKKDSNFFENLFSGIGESVTNFTEKAKNTLSVFIDAVAVLIITTCVIPIAVIFFFIWFTKILFGLNVDLSGMSRNLMKKRGKEPKKISSNVE